MMGEPMKRRLEPAFARIERFIRDGEIDGGALAVAFEGEVNGVWAAVSRR